MGVDEPTSSIQDNMSERQFSADDDLKRKVSIFNASRLFGEKNQPPTYGGSNPDQDDGIVSVDVDDMLLERNERSLGNFSFFGLAIVFGAVGMMFSS